MENSSDLLEEEVLSELLPFLNKEFKKAAAVSGWPSNITSQISVIEEDGNLGIAYPDYLASKIDMLEYGGEGQPPRALLRPFISRFTYDAGRQMADISLYMFMEGEI